MKIKGPSQTGQSASSGKTAKTGAAPSGGASFDALVEAGASDVGATGMTGSIAKVDALLAVQGAENPTEREARKRVRVRAGNLLQELDKIRLALSAGQLTVGHVIGIADIVGSHREKVSDPALTGILDEIDLRAQVELAKMRKSLQSRR